MILRLRGDVHSDVEFPLDRPPAITELFTVAGQWYRVINVLWWLIPSSDERADGWDVALVLRGCPEPDKTEWVKP